MGDTAKTKRREQLKRWAGSSTDRASDVPRRRWRGDAGEGAAGEAEAELSGDPPGEQQQQQQQPESSRRDERSPISSRR